MELPLPDPSQRRAVSIQPPTAIPFKDHFPKAMIPMGQPTSND